jgi:hypothetical protein
MAKVAGNLGARLRLMPCRKDPPGTTFHLVLGPDSNPSNHGKRKRKAPQ